MPATAEPPSGEPPAAPEDDLKQRYREALDRKNARHSSAEAGEGKESTKVHGGAHGPAHQQRTFRRKSG